MRGIMPPAFGGHFQRYGVLTRAVFAACSAALLGVAVALILVPVRQDALAVHGLGAVVALPTGFLLLRSLRLGTIDVSPDAVVVRGLLSTSRISIDEIEHFTAVSGFDQSGQERSALAVRKRSGEVRVFGDFGGSEESRHVPPQELARLLNERITEVRMHSDSDAA